MGLYNFKERFAPFILDGSKTHTIRAIRANPDKPGDLLHLYTGLRTKKARLLMRAPCVAVDTIEIHDYSLTEDGEVLVGGNLLSLDEREELARRDGFRNVPLNNKRDNPTGSLTAWSEMLSFWDGRLPFKGHIIHWKYSK